MTILYRYNIYTNIYFNRNYTITIFCQCQFHVKTHKQFLLICGHDLWGYVLNKLNLKLKSYEIMNTSMFSRNWRYLCRRYSQAVTFRTKEASPVSSWEFSFINKIKYTYKIMLFKAFAILRLVHLSTKFQEGFNASRRQ